MSVYFVGLRRDAHPCSSSPRGSIHIDLSVMHQWKFKSGHRIQQLRGTQRPFWQPRYFDFICRHARDVSNKLDYIH
jgi:hypothetical protein